jgi:pyruvate/2-oxoglutarate dehydrogenase complex dihydrolipoamide acyltransferase (E2) component
VGEGAGEAVGNLDQTVQGVGQTAGHAGEAVGEAAGGVGEGVKGAEEAVGEIGQGAGEAVGGVAQGVGGAAGELEQAAAGVLGGGNGGGGSGLTQAGRTDIAKLAAKLVAKELTAAAKDEAKELGLAATRKAKEVGERRKQRKTEELNATEAALRTADELDVDLDLVDGTGPDGRITIRDVRRAQEEMSA